MDSGVSFTAGLDSNGLRLLRVALSQSLTLGSMLQKLNPAASIVNEAFDGILTVSNLSVVYVPAIPGVSSESLALGTRGCKRKFQTEMGFTSEMVLALACCTLNALPALLRWGLTCAPRLPLASA